MQGNQMKKPSKVMRRTFLLLVCALALFSVKQTCGQIVRGRVVDQERQPVVGVAVVMLDTDSTYLAAAASDADGRFAIASEVRPYRLLFQHLHYLLNGYGWQPLFDPADDDALDQDIERLCRDVFDVPCPYPLPLR